MTRTTTTTTNDTDLGDVVMEMLGKLLVAIVTAAFHLVWLAVLFPMLSVPGSGWLVWLSRGWCCGEC
ncbi:hypothetical protein ASD42_09005 [Nocardia sp. Root136]|uniref:hypothetical protein n=1 Tax=Nocardia sp. Root136 TaxID=1736458 RepID=UPI0006FF3211|nr:hypothetical protein [Nocardia sp. Root136]KQY38523.1 hypothetical protein ASD42_09005 [Nocardia sp. Root136]